MHSLSASPTPTFRTPPGRGSTGYPAPHDAAAQLRYRLARRQARDEDEQGMGQRSKAAAARLPRGPAVAVVRYPSRAPTTSCTVSAEPQRQCRTWPRPHATETTHAYHALPAIQNGTVRATTRALGWRGGRWKSGRRAGLRQGDPHLCPGPAGRRFRRPPSSRPSLVRCSPDGSKVSQAGARARVDLPLSRTLATRSRTRPKPAIRA